MKHILQKLRWKDITMKPFEIVQIETTTYCNLKCPNCPVNSNPRPKALMDWDTFKAIIVDLEQHQFKGRILMQGYGEPLSDSRIIEMVAYTRKAVPLATIQINSNGTLLTQELLDKLGEAGLNMINITGSTRKEFESEIVEVHKRPLPKYLSNIGGLVKVKFNYNKGFPECLKKNTICVNWEGNVVLCCNDYLGLVTFGNVAHEDIFGIWNSEKYVTARKNIRKGIYDYPICKNCVEAK